MTPIDVLTMPAPELVALDRSGDKAGTDLFVRPGGGLVIEGAGPYTSVIRVAGRGYLVAGDPRQVADLLGYKVVGAVRPAPTPRFTPGDGGAVQPYRLGDPA